MSNSFTFRGYDLADYGLTVKSRNIPMQHDIDAVNLHYRAFATDSKFPPKMISLDIAVTAASVATLKTNMDTIKRILNTQTDQTLILDSLDDRYWNARFENMTGVFKGLKFEGKLDFFCLDPCAYDNDLTSNDYTDDEEPEVIQETPGGTTLIEPVFTLTADGQQHGVTVKVNNDTLSMEIEWSGDLENGEKLVFDSSLWLVTLEGTADMSTVAGQFPVLSPGVANQIEVYDFDGNVNITYRNKYI
jgi:predicted phage tail component-like protein